MQKTESRFSVSSKRQKDEKGIILLLGTVSIPVLISMMGLGIDAGMMYGVRGRIQLAADGASLAAARALSLGLTTAEQADSARANASNWFNRNFPAGTFGTTNITLDTPQVFDDPVEPQIRHVVVSAQAEAPSYFMRFWGRSGTPVRVSSDATRRDAVVMMVLDRSGSMNTGGATDACTLMKKAAKKFTGQFAQGRDRIGLLSYSDNIYIHSSPTTDFQTTLGYTDLNNVEYNGLIDNISCNNWTGTPGATIVGYNEVYKLGLPGALNVVLVFTDGVPNAMVLDVRGGTTNRRGILADGTACQDSNNQSVAVGASPQGHMGNNPRQWSSQVDLGSRNFFQYLSPAPANITGQYLAAGPIAGVVDGDNWRKFWATSIASDFGSGWASTPGCGGGTDISALEWLPDTDVFGNILNDTSYRPLTTGTYDGATRIAATSSNWTNASYNASAAAAKTARTTRTTWDGRNFPGAFVFVIGLGSGVNHRLLQRMANDSLADSGGAYTACPTCVTAGQPQGAYIYAQDTNELAPAFVRLASFILRLAQ